jgi:hypothetical protein
MNSTQSHTPPATPAGEEGVLELLRRQVNLYRRLETLSQQQRNQISSDDPQPLLRLLADRQRLTDALVETSRRLAPFREKFSAVRAALETGEREEVDRLLKEAGQRLDRILRADQDDAKLLAARKVRASTALSQTQVGRRMLNAYAPPSGPGNVASNRTYEA